MMNPSRLSLRRVVGSGGPLGLSSLTLVDQQMELGFTCALEHARETDLEGVADDLIV